MENKEHLLNKSLHLIIHILIEYPFQTLLSVCIFIYEDNPSA